MDWIDRGLLLKRKFCHEKAKGRRDMKTTSFSCRCLCTSDVGVDYAHYPITRFGSISFAVVILYLSELFSSSLRRYIDIL
uniref:Uncharacterized protein n=1 Tax=Cucumis melo TaxID=3656 RepID=A0A9I9E8K8_CUCME